MIAWRKAITPPLVSSKPARTALPSASLTTASSASATSTINAGSKSPTHGARDDHAPVLRVETAEASIDELADRLGHGGVAIAPRGRSVVHFDRAGAEVREHDLFDEQRDSVGAADDVADEVVGRMRVEQRGDEVGDTTHAERLDLDDVGSLASQGSHRIVREQRCAGTQRADGRDAGDRGLHQVTHRLETRHVSRVHVIEQDDRASARVGDARDEPCDALQRQQVQLRPVELDRVIRQRATRVRRARAHGRTAAWGPVSHGRATTTAALR